MPNIKLGNWTDYILSFLNSPTNVNKQKLTYFVLGNNETEPAIGCSKLFTSTYKCGESAEKTITIGAEAKGKPFVMDCETEDNKCKNLRLTLEDDGSLTLTTTTGTQLWSNPATLASGNPTEKYDAEHGKYGRNYLMPGEYLSIGEFMGSPSGTCRLAMVGTSTTKSLQILYEINGCENVEDVNNESVSLVTIPETHPEYVGKMGYIDSANKIHAYPSAMQKMENSYTFVGKYSVFGGNLGSNTDAASVADCKTKCNASTECVGVVYDTVDKKCQLKKKEVYQSYRIIKPTYEYHTRNKSALNDSSCPADVTHYETTTSWIPNMGADMTLQTKCGLANHTQVQRAAVQSTRNDLLMMVGGLTQKLSKLTADDKKLTKQLKRNAWNLRSKKAEYEKLKKDKRDLMGNQLKQLKAIAEDSSLNMISKNYKHIMWSIIAILIIIGTIKATR
jgi:hypothetical protein